MSVDTKVVTRNQLPNTMWRSLAFALIALAIGVAAGLLIGRVTLPEPSTASAGDTPVAPAPAVQMAEAPFVDYAIRHAGQVDVGLGGAIASDGFIDYALRHGGPQTAGTSDAASDYALRHAPAVADAPTMSDDYALRHAG